MAKQRHLKVSLHSSGQFVKWIGQTRGKDGNLRPKCWYLGNDQIAAIEKAASLLNEWKTLKSERINAWPERPLLPQSPLPEPKAEAIIVTVGEASREYLALAKADADANQVTEQHYASTRYRHQRVISLLGAGRTLISIGEREVKDFVLSVASRPIVARRNGKPHPMSISYCRRIIKECKLLLEWAYLRGYWPNRPPLFDRLFKYRVNRSTAERAAMLAAGSVEPPHFTVEQLAAIYKVACGRHRLWLQLAMNCGFAQSELDSLRRFEIVGLDTDSARIERFRNKTEVYARWTLWPETALLLRQYIAPPNVDDFALFTERGRRLE